MGPLHTATQRLTASHALRYAGRDALAGSIVAFVTLTYSIGYGVMIFGGSLESSLSLGMPALLLSCCLIALVVALRSSLPFGVGGPDSNTAAIFAIAAAGMALDTRAAGGSDASVIYTVLTAMSITALLTGAVAYAFGRARKGGLMQLVPYSVVAGLLAGSGFLTVSGGFRILTSHPLDLAALDVVRGLDPVSALPAVAIAAVLLTSRRVRQQAWGLPSVIVLAAIGFYGFAAVAGLQFADLRSNGMLFDPFSIGLLTPLATMPFGLVAWQVIANHAFELLTVLIVTLLTVLLNSGALDLATRRDVDINRELEAAGLANMLTGLGGGMVGYQSVSRTILNFKVGGTGRLSGVWASGVCLAVVALFPGVISFMPRAVAAGVVMYLGCSMLLEWAVASRRQLPVYEYALVLVILGVIAVAGVLVGVVVGVLGACVLFAWDYGQVSCVKTVFTGRSYRSRVRRPIRDERVLREHGDSTFGLSLHGYLFFGTARTIVNRVAQALRETNPHNVVIDMGAVQGIDTSALMSLRKLRQLCEPRGAVLVLAGLSAGQRAQLCGGGVLDQSDVDFPDLDQALEWIEARLLVEFGSGTLEPDLRKMLAPHFRPENLERLLFLLEPLSLEAGQVVFTRGERGDAALFIERGQLGVWLRQPDGGSVRLASYGPGTLAGEQALFTSETQPADVVADTETRVMRLTRRKLGELERTSPQAALELKTLVIQTLAARLAVANSESQVG
jgi:SulP family sulfate permease